MNCSSQYIIPHSISPPSSSSIHCKPYPSSIFPTSKAKPSLNNLNGSQNHLPQPVIPLSKPNSTFHPYSSLIQSCIDSQSFSAGRSIHTQMLAEGFVPDTYLQTKILMLYARSGDRDDMEVARRLFDEMPVRNSTAWNTMILAYSRENNHEEVVRLFSQMLRDGVSPGKFTFPSVIKGCVALDEIEAVPQVHSLIIKVGLNSNRIVGGALVDWYAGFGLIDDAVAALGEIDEDNVIAWNAILSGYMKLSMWEVTWGAFHWMRSVSAVPDQFTFSTVIQACGALRSLSKGKQVHSNLVVYGYEADVFAINSLIDMYASCGDEDSCRVVFELMKERNQVSWNSIISSYNHLGYYEEALKEFLRMQDSGYQCDRFNLGSCLVASSALANVDMGRQIHGFLVRRSLDTDLILGTAVVDMYSKCECIEKACCAFDKLETRSEVSWNALISGFVQEEQAEAAIELYHKMRSSIRPDQFTFACLLTLSANQGSLDLGKQVHGYIIRMEFKLNVVVETELVHMYVRCGRFREAENIFCSMHERNNYSWNSLIEGHEQNGNYSYALYLFYQMQLTGIKPDCFSLLNALSACTGLSNINRGKQIHGFMIRNRIEDHGVLSCMLVDLYAQCETMSYAYKVYEHARVKDVFLHNMMITACLDHGRIDEARRIFDHMEEKTVVSWNIMLNGYSKGHFKNETFRIFLRMTQEGSDYEPLTLVPLLNVCASLPVLELGEMLHTIVIKGGFSYCSLILDSVVVDMYSKCGSLEDARRYFDRMDEKNTVTWNSMITGYGKHGQIHEVFELYKQMRKEDLKPNNITFLSILSACSHSGLVEEGIDCFITMLEDHEVEARAEHYTCMVDLLGRAGYLEEAKEVIDKMPIEPEVSTWGALLGACRIHKDTHIGRLAAEKLFQLDTENPGHYVLMANIYSSVGMWKEADHIRELMKSRGVKKEPGVSWILINNEAHIFHAGDQTHPLSEEIHKTLKDLTPKIKRIGYVPDENFVLRNVNDSEEYLLQHSEKLAVCLGLIKLHKNSAIRIFKNLRTCGDCHVAIKLISEVTGRTIIVRDTNQFHHFKDGACSCGDYW